MKRSLEIPRMQTLLKATEADYFACQLGFS